MAIKIEIISNAFVLLGASPIASLDGTAEGTVASSLYEQNYKSLLASHNWRFATKKVQLSRLVDAPLNEYKYQYQLPTDLITVEYVYNNSDYEIYEDKLYSDQPTVEIDYRFNVDETNLPDYFVTTLEFMLAALFAVPITDNSQRAQLYFGMYQDQLKRAKFIDSSSRPFNQIQDSPLTDIY